MLHANTGVRVAVLAVFVRTCLHVPAWFRERYQTKCKVCTATQLEHQASNLRFLVKHCKGAMAFNVGGAQRLIPLLFWMHVCLFSRSSVAVFCVDSLSTVAQYWYYSLLPAWCHLAGVTLGFAIT
jgi:hypothetical protein